MEDSSDPGRARIDHVENLLKNAILMAEIGADLKEKCTIADKYMNDLKVLISKGTRSLVPLQNVSKSCLLGAKNLLTSVPPTNLNPKIKEEYQRLLSVVTNHLVEFAEQNGTENAAETDMESPPSIWCGASRGNLPSSGSCKSANKLDVDEKYPESWSRDSSIDLSNVNNLPSVPEDVFTAFSSSIHNKPKRSSSLSSLKSMRKVKLFLQRAETSEDDETSSDTEEHDLVTKGDSDDGISIQPKKYLGNITEESQDY